MIHSMIRHSAEPESGALFLSRFEDAYREATGNAFGWDLPSAKQVATIFGNSTALAEKLIRNPTWAGDFASDKKWAKKRSREEIEKDLSSIVEIQQPMDTAGWQRALRHFKYRQMIRIAARDLASAPKVAELLREWSDVADIAISAAYDCALKMCAAQFGEPGSCTGAVIALGKLGGRELNMSSDVDLLCIYRTDEGTTSGGPKDRLSHHEFFTKVVTLFTQILSPVTEDGFVFRVDHDLRPEGPKGPLVNSLEAAERYYETFGRDWERQALIRARAVAGDLELGRQFIDEVQPFVYRRSLSIGDLSHLKEMKNMMEAKTKHISEDIKFGRGGIRELEFLIQAFQQVFGGRFRDVRVQNTFDAIDALEKNDLIHPHGAATLKEAYSFLRRLENMLQIANDQQIHHLPRDAKGLAETGRRMGIDADVLHEWRRHGRLVHKLFRGVFEADYERLELEEAITANLATCTTDEERADSLPWFKHQEVRRLSHLDINNKIALPDLLKRLTLVAEVVLGTAWELASKNLMKRYGMPSHENGTRASFAIAGFGRLGSREIDYGSDLDLCFLYSGEGRTKGPEVISNSEFFTKLSQRVISLISIHSRYGRAYQIDSELRPSGHQGSLVATLESFRNYHSNEAKLWERQALLKSRVIAGDEPFAKETRITLTGLAYKAPTLPEEEMRRQITKLRSRFETEVAQEGEGTYNLKIGSGGMADIEAIIQYHQLIYAKKHTELWIQNGFELINVLHDISYITDEYYEIINRAYSYYRRLMSRLRLFTHSATDLIDRKAPYIEALAGTFGQTTEDLIGGLENERREVRKLFNRIFQE